MVEGQRLAATKYPRIWSEFTVSNPITQTFKIGDIPESFLETVIKELRRLYIENTPIEFRAEILADEVLIAEKEEWWREVLKQRLSLICLAEPTNGMSVVKAFSINARWSLLNKERKFEGKETKWAWAIQRYIYGRRSFYADFKVSEAIIALTIFTASHCSGGGKVHEELYKCRPFLCRATGIKLFLACFVIEEGQNPNIDTAIEAGYKEYVRVPYEELASVDRSYPLIKCDCFQLMFKFYE